jgi:hypothetical protein
VVNTCKGARVVSESGDTIFVLVLWCHAIKPMSHVHKKCPEETRWRKFSVWRTTANMLLLDWNQTEADGALSSLGPANWVILTKKSYTSWWAVANTW